MFFPRARDDHGKVKVIVAVFCCALFVLVGFIVASAMMNAMRSRADELEDGTRLAENAELTYYLKVKYDGVDRQGVQSSDSATAEVRSDLIRVNDPIPDGLIFEGFVESADGTFGAVERRDNSTPCAGTVVDDTGDEIGWNTTETEYVYHGLHYDKATNTVTFGVRNLRAGCQLQVGIKTRTPYLREGERRRDFYNTANFSEGLLDDSSNTVHTYIGRDDIATYKVTYRYTGTVPDGAPSLPSEVSYQAGETVDVAADARLDGYVFSGWSTSDATVEDGSFTMPAQQVILVGIFTEKPKYSVTYSITGSAPSTYRLPKQKSYGAGDVVDVDSLQAGAIVDGWMFSGWTTNDVTVSGGSFTMPDSAVAFTGSFDRISYTVSYAFQGEVLPQNAESLLPATASYYPGDEVTTAANPTAIGYLFSGWYKGETFTMPEENVVIVGEWTEVITLFRPTISIRITNPRDDGYYKNETVQFEITVTNPSEFEIFNINVGLGTEGVEFVTDEGYTIRSDQLAQVTSLAAGASVKLYAKYDVLTNEERDIVSVARLLSATAEGNNRMDTSDEAMATYVVSVPFRTIYFEQDPPFTGIISKSLLPFIALIALGAIGGATIARKKRQQ